MAILTNHARVRMQQRGIPAAALEVLLDFGRVRHVHDRGREIIFFDKAARTRLFQELPTAAKQATRLTRAYAILGSDGDVITVGHRYRRVPRD